MLKLSESVTSYRLANGEVVSVFASHTFDQALALPDQAGDQMLKLSESVTSYRLANGEGVSEFASHTFDRALDTVDIAIHAADRAVHSTDRTIQADHGHLPAIEPISTAAERVPTIAPTVVMDESSAEVERTSPSPEGTLRHLPIPAAVACTAALSTAAALSIHATGRQLTAEKAEEIAEASEGDHVATQTQAAAPPVPPPMPPLVAGADPTPPEPPWVRWVVTAAEEDKARTAVTPTKLTDATDPPWAQSEKAAQVTVPTDAINAKVEIMIPEDQDWVVQASTQAQAQAKAAAEKEADDELYADVLQVLDGGMPVPKVPLAGQSRNAAKAKAKAKAKKARRGGARKARGKEPKAEPVAVKRGSSAKTKSSARKASKLGKSKRHA